MTDELERLKADRESKASDVAAKEAELANVKMHLERLSHLIKETDLLCPKCGSPLIVRNYRTIYGYVDGREIDAEVEYIVSVRPGPPCARMVDREDRRSD